LGKHVVTIGGAVQLDGDHQLSAVFTDTALDGGVGMHPAADFPDIGLSSLKLEGACARDHSQGADPR